MSVWLMEVLVSMFFLLSKKEFLSKNKAIAVLIRAMVMLTNGRLVEIVRLVFFMGCWCIADSLVV